MFICLQKKLLGVIKKVKVLCNLLYFKWFLNICQHRWSGGRYARIQYLFTPNSYVVYFQAQRSDFGIPSQLVSRVDT